MLRILAIISALSTLAACGSGVTEFPASWEPLGEVTLTAPESEGLVVHAVDADDWIEGQAIFVVDTPADNVWEALRQADVVADRRRVDEWSGLVVSAEGADYALTVTNTTTEVITVSFDITWRHKVLRRDDLANTAVVVRWQKTFGPDLIERLEGSMVLEQVGDERTEVRVVQRLQTPTSTPEELELYLSDVYADTRAASHGLALPAL